MYFKHYEGWEDGPLQDRGRWGSREAMKTYHKAHLLVKNEGRATQEEHDRGSWLMEDVSRMGLPLPLEPLSSAYPLILESILVPVPEVEVEGPGLDETSSTP
jgi:hypothetical protein